MEVSWMVMVEVTVSVAAAVTSSVTMTVVVTLVVAVASIVVVVEMAVAVVVVVAIHKLPSPMKFPNRITCRVFDEFLRKSISPPAKNHETQSLKEHT
jgi:hypothetical protein